MACSCRMICGVLPLVATCSATCLEAAVWHEGVVDSAMPYQCALRCVHVQLTNLRDFRPATFSELTAIHSEQYVSMLEEVRLMQMIKCSFIGMG